LNIVSSQETYSNKRTFCHVHSKMCFYEVLGITSKATTHEIKKAYYSKVKKFHPDHNREATAEESFKIVANAYETLKNTDTRQLYDSKRRNPNFTPDQDFTRTSSSNYNSASSNQYKYYNSGSTEGFDGYHGAWRDSNAKKQADEAARNRWQQESYKTSSTTSSSNINNVITRVSLVVVVFVLIDLWRKQQNKNTKKPSQSYSTQNQVLQTGSGPLMIEPNDDFTNREMYRKEMEEKKFKIEHHKAIIHVSPEAAQAQKMYKKEKKIYDIDGFIAKKNIQIIKSEDPFGKVQ